MCTSTAFIVLCSGAYKATNLEGIELTQNALSSQIGPWASSFLAIIIFLFAFSSLLETTIMVKRILNSLNKVKLG